jgi:hypothetical protein
MKREGKRIFTDICPFDRFLVHTRKQSRKDNISLGKKDDMSRKGPNGYWEKTIRGWQHISYDGDGKMSNRRLKPWLRISSLKCIHVGSTMFVAWQCVITYITSPNDLRNLAATCRSLNKLVENESCWSHLIRTKFGNTLWLRHVRQIFYSQNNQQIDLHDDIETMENDKLIHKCVYLPADFLFNRAEDYSKPLIRTILRSYQYYLEKEISNRIVYIDPSQFIFRWCVSFNHVHIEHLTNAQRRTVPLTKLIYFYLADQRYVPVVNFDIIRPRE